MSNLVAIAYPDAGSAVGKQKDVGGEVIQTGLGPEREAELQEALAGQAATV